MDSDPASAAATTYVVQTEGGLPIRSTSFARIVDRTLGDVRSWAQGDTDTLARTNNPGASLRILLATPATTDELCAPLDTRGRVSCRNGANVVINAWRWVNGAESYANDLDRYRQYVVNHEVGHALGHPHAACPVHGELASVMVQQTLGLDGCRANPWPSEVDLSSHP